MYTHTHTYTQLCMYMHIHLHMHIHMYIYICIYTYVYMNYTHIHTCVYTYMCICVYIYIYTYIYIYIIHMCMYMYTYIYIYLYTYIAASARACVRACCSCQLPPLVRLHALSHRCCAEGYCDTPHPPPPDGGLHWSNGLSLRRLSVATHSLPDAPPVSCLCPSHPPIDLPLPFFLFLVAPLLFLLRLSS